MKRSLLVSFGVLPLLVACGGAEPPPPAPPPPPPPAPLAATNPAPTAEAPKPAEPTPEEKKKAEEQKQLAEDRAKWEDAQKAELARWTPELHAEAKALVDKEKSAATGKAAIQLAMAGKHRAPASAERDKFRHPVETLDFFGFKPSMTVLDIGPGEGWYTELLAPALANKGKYLATNGDPNGPPDARSTFYAQRFKAFLDKSPEAYGKVETVTIDSKAPALPMEGTVDMVLIMRGVHGMKNSGTFGTWLGEIYKALKPNGVLGIEEHRAKAGANVDETAKKGYVPEKWVIEQAQAAGFKLAAKSEVNANAKDTKDYPEGVWSLPPTFREKDKDHDKYAAIGESDRMTLKFVKVPHAATGATSTPKKDASKGSAPKADASKGSAPKK